MTGEKILFFKMKESSDSRTPIIPKSEQMEHKEFKLREPGMGIYPLGPNAAEAQLFPRGRNAFRHLKKLVKEFKEEALSSAEEDEADESEDSDPHGEDMD